MVKKNKKLIELAFDFCTSGLQVFVGTSALQEETRCEALEGLEIIANVF